MNKKTIAEQAHRILSGGDPSVEIEVQIQEVRMAAGQIIDKVVLEYLVNLNKIEKTADFRVPSDFTTSASVSLSSKVGTAPDYLKLPSDRGIQEVTIGSGSSLAYLYPILSRGGLSDGLESSSLEGNDGYRINGSSIAITTDISPSTCTVHYVQSAAKASLTDELVFPDFLMEESIKRVVKQFMPHIEIPEDKVIDNKDK